MISKVGRPSTAGTSFFYSRRLQKKVSTAASASERERPDVEIFIPGAYRIRMREVLVRPAVIRPPPSSSGTAE